MKIKNTSLLSGLSGKYGDFIICQTKDGPIMKRKANYSASKRATDPRYARVRDNSANFATAGRAVKLVRAAFERPLKFAKDAKLTPRMQAVMMQVVKSDLINGCGLRTAANGDLSLLQGFECNADANFALIGAGDYTVNIDRILGRVTLNNPSIKPKSHLVHPDKATHFRITCAVAEIDFNENIRSTNDSASGLLPLNSKPTGAIILTTAINPGSTLPVFVAMGIQFVEMINGKEFPFESREFNPLCFVKIEKP